VILLSYDNTSIS